MNLEIDVNFQVVLKQIHTKRNHIKEDLPVIYNFCQSFCVFVEFTSLLAMVL